MIDQTRDDLELLQVIVTDSMYQPPPNIRDRISLTFSSLQRQAEKLWLKKNARKSNYLKDSQRRLPITHPCYPSLHEHVSLLISKDHEHCPQKDTSFSQHLCVVLLAPLSSGPPLPRLALRSHATILGSSSARHVPPLGFLSGYSVHFGSGVCCHPPSSLARRNLIPTGKERGRTFDHIDREIERSLCRCSLRLESSRGGESHRVVYGGICDILPISMAVTFLKPRGSLHRAQ